MFIIIACSTGCISSPRRASAATRHAVPGGAKNRFDGLRVETTGLDIGAQRRRRLVS
jgi:hypothetical protein